MKKTKVATVSTSNIIKSVSANRTDLPQKVVKEVLSEFLGAIADALATDAGKVRMDGIGILRIRHRAARAGRNPLTGEALKIPASKGIAFRAAVSLKEQIKGSAKKTKEPVKKSKAATKPENGRKASEKNKVKPKGKTSKK